MSSSKNRPVARFRIDAELKSKIIDDFKNGATVESLTSKYDVPHPEYVRRVVSKIERGKCRRNDRWKVSSPFQSFLQSISSLTGEFSTIASETEPKRVSFATSTCAPGRNSNSPSKAKKRKANEVFNESMDVDPDVTLSYPKPPQGTKSVVKSSTQDTTPQRSTRKYENTPRPRNSRVKIPTQASTSTEISPDTRLYNFSSGANTQTEGDVFSPEYVECIESQLESLKNQKAEMESEISALRNQMTTLESQLKLKEERLQMREEEIEMMRRDLDLDNSISTHRESVEKVKMKEKVSLLHSKVQSLEEQLKSKNEMINDQATKIESLRQRFRLKEADDSLQKELAIREKQVQDQAARILSLESNLARTNEQLTKLKTKLAREAGWKNNF